MNRRGFGKQAEIIGAGAAVPATAMAAGPTMRALGRTLFSLRGMKLKIILAVVILAAFSAAFSAHAAFPDPVAQGRKAAESVLSRDPGWNPLRAIFMDSYDFNYQMSCGRYGVLMFADVTGEKSLVPLVAKTSPVLRGLVPPARGHVDQNVFGIVPLELFRQTGKAAYLKVGRTLADDEFKKPQPGGLAAYTRFWVDDMYMVGNLQTQAWRNTHDPVYLDHAFAQLLAYCDRLQQPDGLFWHNLDSHYYWGRGNGWAAASMTELLLAAPADDPRRPALMAAWQKMMAALLKHQDPSGMWHQLLDDPASYPETSCTGMFTFALATGAREGWLGPEGKMAAEKGWTALVTYQNDDGKIRDVCVGTGAVNNHDYYLARPRSTGDLHGQAAFLWAASAIIQLER
jgi:unsaturated rhamnogalacturonyl hydrolase